jgi:hypothetical protein
MHPLYLLFDSCLNGEYRLSLDGPVNAFRLWKANSTNGVPLLTCGETITLDSAVPGEAAGVWLEVLAPGTATVTLSFIGAGNAEGREP